MPKTQGVTFKWKSWIDRSRAVLVDRTFLPSEVPGLIDTARIAPTLFTAPIYPIEIIWLPASRSCTTCDLTAERSLTLDSIHQWGIGIRLWLLNTLRERRSVAAGRAIRIALIGDNEDYSDAKTVGD